LAFSAVKPVRADCEPVSSDFQVFSLVEANVCLLDAHLHEIAHRFRNLRLHECLIGHATLLDAYLPFLIYVVLWLAPIVHSAYGLVDGQEPSAVGPRRSPPKAFEQQQ
jgi:hypothetical protein